MITQTRKDFDATDLIVNASAQALMREGISTETELLVCKFLLELSAHREHMSGIMIRESRS